MYTIDDDLKKFVFQLDINSTKDLTEKINFINNDTECKKIIDESNKFYNLIFDEKYIHKNLKDIINSYLNYSKKWKF